MRIKVHGEPLLRVPNDKYIRESTRDALQTSLALLFHSSGNKLQLVTAHKVVQEANRAPIIAAGRPLTHADERDVLDLLTSRTQDAGFAQVFPERLLFADPTRTLWWLPSAIRPMHLRDPNGLVTIKTRWPALVLLAMDATLCVAALATDERPNVDTKLYHSTLPNVYESTAMCTGDARLPLSATPDQIPAWESVVLDSAFSHANFHGAVRGRDHQFMDVAKYWRGRDGKKHGPTQRQLVPLGKTLAQWFTNAQGRSQ